MTGSDIGGRQSTQVASEPFREDPAISAAREGAPARHTVLRSDFPGDPGWCADRAPHYEVYATTSPIAAEPRETFALHVRPGESEIPMEITVGDP